MTPEYHALQQEIERQRRLIENLEAALSRAPDPRSPFVEPSYPSGTSPSDSWWVYPQTT